MKKILVLCYLLAIPGVAIGSQTIVTQETEGYFYADSNMKKYVGQFEITYLVEDDKVTRTRVYDLRKKEVIPDDTVYTVQKQLTSDPNNPQHMPALDKNVIRAIGQPGLDAVEILVITDKAVQSCKSTSNYFVISNSKRIK
jgi:hypothetical protein